MEVKDLYNQNYKTLKKFKKTLKDGKISHIHGLAELLLWNGHVTESDL
jgi:hypothetical protein